MSRLQFLNLKTVFKQIITAGETGFQSRIFPDSRYYSKLNNWGTKKDKKHINLIYFPEGMASSQVEQILAPLRAAVKKQVSVTKYLLFLKNKYHANEFYYNSRAI